MEEVKKLIYAADDEANIRNLIKCFLEKEGYLVEVFETGDSLYGAFLLKPSDLVILDVMMPGKDGFSICSDLRHISTVPILMLTARDGESDYITGITLGSDDYFTKPFRPLQLVLRIKAIFRRINMEKQSLLEEAEQLSYGDLVLFPGQKVAAIRSPQHGASKELGLTMTEFSLLFFLLENRHRAVPREELLNKIWGYDSFVETRATDDTVKRLRKKLNAFGSRVKIETVWGFGFRLTVLE